MTTDSLLPCPWCSTPPTIYHFKPADNYFIECSPTCIRNRTRSTKEQVIKEWNRRAHLSAPQPEPVAWRWRAKGATLWVYDPESEWMGAQGDAIEAEPLYAAPPKESVAPSVVAHEQKLSSDEKGESDRATKAATDPAGDAPQGETTFKFENVSCSECGQEFGPGDHGFSHCENHRLLLIARRCAKARPQSYYSEPFWPHDWVIDAMREAVRHAMDRAKGDPEGVSIEMYNRDLERQLLAARREVEVWKASAVHEMEMGGKHYQRAELAEQKLVEAKAEIPYNAELTAAMKVIKSQAERIAAYERAMPEEPNHYSIQISDGKASFAKTLSGMWVYATDYEALRHTCAGYRADAERWRWLKPRMLKHTDSSCWFLMPPLGDKNETNFDSAIDAAIDAKGAKP